MPTIDDADLVEAVAADAEGLRYRRVGPADWSRLPLEHVSVLGCQFSGTSLRESVWEDVVVSGVLFVFESCRLDYATFDGVRTSGPVAFINCTLIEASLAACRWDQVVFDRCRLSGLELDRCDLRGADLRGNDLDSVRGIMSLRGITITADQLADLTTAMAADLDLQVSPPGTPSS